MTLETDFGFPPGSPDEGQIRTVVSTLIDLAWIAPERHGGYSNPLATPKKDAVEAITSYWREHGLVVVEGGGAELTIRCDAGDERTTFQSLSCWTPTVPPQHAEGMARIARVLRSPVSVASRDPHGRLYRLVPRGQGQERLLRLRGYGEGLIGLYWRNVLGPPFTTLFGDSLRRLPAEGARDLGDGFWFIELGERPEDETSDDGRRRESEIIDALGRDAFYDLKNEKKPTRLPDVGVASVDRYVIVYRESPEFSLAIGRELLVHHAFEVKGTADNFTARWRGGPEVHVRLSNVAAAKAEIEKRAYMEDDERAKLATLDAAIEVTFVDDPNVSDVNTIRLSERVLREATGGLVFQRWDDSLYDGRLEKIARYKFTVLATGFSIEQARDALAESDFRIGPIPGGYSVQWHGGPVLYLRTVDAAAARKEIEERIGEQPELAGCDAAIDVAFDDLDEAQDEANTLIESQMQLASASSGFLFLHWNDTLQTPE
ncbi:MAG: hypothetical protein ACKV2T_31765 [Kofleriaceae bacterium]